MASLEDQSESGASDTDDDEHASVNLLMNNDSGRDEDASTDILSNVAAIFRPDPGLPRLQRLQVSDYSDYTPPDEPMMSLRTRTTSRLAFAGVRSLHISMCAHNVDLLPHLLRSLIGLEKLQISAHRPQPFHEHVGPFLLNVSNVMATCKQVQRTLRAFEMTVEGGDRYSAIDDVTFVSTFSKFERLESLRLILWQRPSVPAHTATLPKSLKTLDLQCNGANDVPGFLDILTRTAQAGKLPSALRSVNVYSARSIGRSWVSPEAPKDVQSTQGAYERLRAAVASLGVQVNWYAGSW